ncbi:MAG: Rho termination factor N-terminal domain-containing protein [Mogibacterium sp.]|nr:Rho termination factor N-terminal domain-containing protein [Mogibacterium sp.]
MEKKLRKSPVVIALYVIAALVLVYACYLAGGTVSQINEYYAAYGMTAKAGEFISYILQSVYMPLIMAVLLFAAGKILNEVRALNPAYYATSDEIAQAKAAKKAAKAAEKAEEKVVEAEEKADDVIVFSAKEAEEETVAVEASEEIKADINMKKAELLEIAEKLGVEVSAKATKAEILEAIEKR